MLAHGISAPDSPPTGLRPHFSLYEALFSASSLLFACIWRSCDDGPMKTAANLGVWTLVCAFLGCSSGDNPSGLLPPPGIMPAPATCGTVLPCGGDLTGTWKIIGGCLGPGDGETLPCAGTVQLLTLSFAGTMTFNADMTFTFTDMANDRAEIDTVPTSCLPTKTCAEQDAEYKSMVKTGALNYGSCTGTSTCSCTTALDGAYSQSGTYSIQGNQFQTVSYFDGGGSDAGTGEYCVQDGLLHSLTIEEVMDSSGTFMAVVEQDVVAQLQ
jgi:hypothetical protein